MSVYTNALSYGLNDKMVINWNVQGVSNSNSMGIWLFATDHNYNPTTPPLFTDNKWPLVYNTNPYLTSWTVDISQILRSSPDNILLSEGPFFTVLIFNAIGDRLASLPYTISFTTDKLSLGNVLLGGNYASTNIDMLNNALVSSGPNLFIGDSTTENVRIYASGSPGVVDIAATGTIGLVSIAGNTCNIGNDKNSSVKVTNQVNISPGLGSAVVNIAPSGLVNIGSSGTNNTTGMKLYCPIDMLNSPIVSSGPKLLLGDSSTQNVTIQSNTLTMNGTMGVNSPIQLNYSPSNITSPLCSGYNGVVWTKLGSWSQTGPSLPGAGGPLSIYSVQLTKGVWYLQAHITSPPQIPTTYQTLCFSTVTNTIQYDSCNTVSVGDNECDLSISHVVSVNTTATYYLVAAYGGNQVTIFNVNTPICYRIA
jgi:hypothetical protein